MPRLDPLAVGALLKEVREQVRDEGRLVVSGALARELARELGRGASPGWVVEGGPAAGAAVLVHVLAGAPAAEDERALREAHRRRVPIVGVQTGREPVDVPYVLATDVVTCEPGHGFPVEQIARAVAARLGDRGAALAAKVPALRDAVCAELIRRAARRNGVIGVAVFVPGADMPILTLNQIRLVLRLALAHGIEVDASRAPEVLAVVGSGFALRTAAREALGLVPVAGWAVKGAVAYAGTRAIGEAALRYFRSVRPRT